MCSAALEAFGTAWTASAPTQHAKSENVGCWPSEPLDTLIGCVLAVWPFWLAVVLANQRGVWEGQNTVCATELYGVCCRSVISCCCVSDYWPEISAERTRYCVISSRRGGMFQCDFSAERVRREATERSDKGSWMLVWVWAVCRGLKKRCNKTDANERGR